MRLEPSFMATHTIKADLTRIERARAGLEAVTLSEDWIRATPRRRGPYQLGDGLARSGVEL